jgi:hypothetical protein
VLGARCLPMGHLNFESCPMSYLGDGEASFAFLDARAGEQINVDSTVYRTVRILRRARPFRSRLHQVLAIKGWLWSDRTLFCESVCTKEETKDPAISSCSKALCVTAVLCTECASRLGSIKNKRVNPCSIREGKERGERVIVYLNK